MAVSPPLNLHAWIDAHQHLLQPPVGNQYLYDGDELFVMVVGGPSARNDFRITPSEVFFHQITGDMTVRIRDEDRMTDYRVGAGETFFIPAGVPHSPRRPSGTVGLVVQRRRSPGETEQVVFYCDKCGGLVWNQAFDQAGLVEQFKAEMEAFWADDERRTCRNCGAKVEKPLSLPTD